jgi:uncharacterized membrane protein
MKDPIEYIKEAWGIYTKKENFVFFARIMAVLALLSTAIGFVTSYFYPADYIKNIDFSNVPMFIGFLAISLISLIIGLWSQSTQYLSVIKMGDSEVEILKLGYYKIIKFWTISLVVGIIITFGAILLIIPAIIFGVWYGFSVFLVLDKNMGVFEALKASKQMVKGKSWKILGRSAVFVLFTIIISILLSVIPYAGSLLLSFIAPLFLLPFYLLYRDLGAGSRLNDLGAA